MPIKTSYSQLNTFVNCPKHWHWKYREKLDPAMQGASLSFGTAIDNAVMSMLKGEKDYLIKFKELWHTAKIKNNKTEEIKEFQIFDNIEIVYSYSDFDGEVLQSEDLVKMSTWIEELGIKYDKNEPIQTYKQIVKKRKSEYVNPTGNEIRYFGRCSWLSLLRKGEILIDSFYKQFYPKIKSVISVQRFGVLEDSHTGDGLMGALDFVVELEGYDKPIIFDLKTSSRMYTKDNIDLSEQLSIYMALFADKFNTDLVGYVVLVKNINKTKVSTCVSCGNIKNSAHRNCNNILSSGRCKGEWKEENKIDPQVQVMVRKKTKEEVNAVLRDSGNIIEAMKLNIIYRDLSKCNNWYGNKCPYFDACHKGDITGLRRRY